MGASSVREVMTPAPAMLGAKSLLNEAARVMRDGGIGDVLVERDGRLCGIVTDRDIVVRAVAEGQDPARTAVGDICSKELTFVGPDDAVDAVVATMRAKALRRVPVMDGDTLVGIVSLGDLAIDRDPGSALADVSAAPSNT